MKVFTKLDPLTQEVNTNIKEKAQELLDIIPQIPSRELALAKTKLEECVMWAVKGMCILDKEGKLNNGT